MSRFYGRVNGQAKTEATRRGGEKSGLVTECNGWHVGVKCMAGVHIEDDADTVAIYATGGSTGAVADTYLGQVTVIDGKPLFVASKE